MTKKFFVLTALVAMVLAVAAPIAFAHDGQEGVVGPQPVEWTGEEATVTGLLEPVGEKLDGTPVWRMEDEASGSFYHVEQGEGVTLAAFEGQRVSLHGTLGYLEGNVILADSVEPLQETTAGEAQYGRDAATGEEFSGTGTVEYLDDKADGTPVYGLSVSPAEGHYMEGDFDFAAFEGEQANVTGHIVYSEENGRYLWVESIEPVADANVEDGEAVEEDETVPAPSPEPVAEVEQDGVEETTPAVAATDADEAREEVAEETVAVDLASEEAPLPSEPVEKPAETGLLSAAVGALPITGGAALLIPLAGLGLAAAGLAAFRMTR